MTTLLPAHRPTLTGLSREVLDLVVEHSRILGVEPTSTPHGLEVAAQTKVTVETLRRSGPEDTWIALLRQLIVLLAPPFGSERCC